MTCGLYLLDSFETVNAHFGGVQLYLWAMELVPIRPCHQPQLSRRFVLPRPHKVEIEAFATIIRMYLQPLSAPILRFETHKV